MKISTKLILGFGLVFVLLAVVALTAIFQNRSNISDVRLLADEVVEDTMLVVDLRKEVLQIQQFFTDIAATRQSGGEAAKEAEASFGRASVILVTLIGRHEHEGDDEVARLRSIMQDVETYFWEGHRMASVYVEEGTEAGNAIMLGFDAIAAELTAEVELLVDEHVAQQDEALAGLAERATSGITVSILVSGLSFVAMFLVSFLLSRSLIRSTSKLVELTETAATGDLRKQVVMTSKDELGRFGNLLNEFIGKLKGIIVEIKATSFENVAIKQELVAGAEETSASLVEISASIDSINKQARLMSEEIGSSTASSEEVARTVGSMNAQIVNQAAMVEESTASVTEMMASIQSVSEITQKEKASTDRLVRAAEDGGAKVTAMISAVGQIENSISSILEITKMISGIASQTNMLSMNAAIEAAHAGDYGRGFAVVAEEIRTLAETSSENSREIAGILKNMVSSIDGVSESVGQTDLVFRSINKEIMDVSTAFSEIYSSMTELQLGGRQILDAVASLQDVTTAVKDGFTEINTGVGDVAHSMNSIQQISSDVTMAIAEIASGTQDISRAMSNLTSISVSLDGVVEKLTAKIDTFITE